MTKVEDYLKRIKAGLNAHDYICERIDNAMQRESAMIMFSAVVDGQNPNFFFNSKPIYVDITKFDKEYAGGEAQIQDILLQIKKEYEEAGWLVDLEFTVPYNVNTKQVALMTFEMNMQ